MFVIDYEQHLLDHGKILVLIRNFDPPCSTVFFDQAFTSVLTHHSVIYPKLAGARQPRRYFTTFYKDSTGDLPLDDPTALDDNSLIRDQPLWIRYVKDYSSFNNSWASFQSHRAVLGLIGFSCCSTTEQVISAIQSYLRQKALISEQQISGRLFVLVPPEATMTIEQANEVINSEYQKLLHNLPLAEAEVMAHPMDQFFNIHLYVHDSAVNSTFLSGCMFSPQMSCHSKPTNSPLLSPRVARSLTDLASEICSYLEQVISSVDPKTSQLRALSVKPTIMDMDGSESGISGLTVPIEYHSHRSPDGENSEDRQFSVKPFINLISSDTAASTPNLPLSNDSSGMKQRRISGRWKKHLADVALQLGELDLAQLYYETTLQLLRPIMDNLWIAGAIEGSCALAVIRQTGRHEPSEFSARSRELRSASSLEKELSKSADFSDISVQKLKHATVMSPTDYSVHLFEALDFYRRSGIDERMLEETTFKFARLLVSEKQTTRALELLDSFFTGSFDDQSDSFVPLSQRLTTLVKLYCDLGCYRRASFAAWKSIERSLPLPPEMEFDVLFQHLRIRVVNALVWSDADPFSPGSPLNPASVLSASSLWNVGKQATYSPVLRRPAIPTCFSPVVIKRKSVWYRGASGHVRNRSKLDRGARPILSRRQNRFNKNSTVPEHFTFRTAGWSSLQAAVIQQLIEMYKFRVNFDDMLEIPWENGLHLIGLIFSLLDGWPNHVNRSYCATAMEDLCRLAILRSPDQPAVSHSLFEADISGSVTLSKKPSVDNELNDPVNLRQFVDLVEIPVHQLPCIRLVNPIELPEYLVPRELSKEGVASAIPVTVVNISPISVNGQEGSARKSSDSGPNGLFFYAPTDFDPSGRKNGRIVDWVCQEPVDLELIVDNVLPVELRIADVRVELLRLSAPSGELNSPGVLSPTHEDTTPPFVSDPMPSIIHLDAIRLVMEKPAPQVRSSVPGRSRSVESSYTVELNQSCLLEAAHDRRVHPCLKTDSNWRRLSSPLSCSLPANTTGIRLIVTVRPNINQFSSEIFYDNQDFQTLYRIVGLTYRLIDFGAMHVCFRAPHSCFCDVLNPVNPSTATRDHSSATGRERRLSNSSSSAASTLSFLRLSLNSDFESLQPTSDSTVPEHPSFNVVKSILTYVPAIRLRPPMPRLCIFPGIVRSACNLKEAKEFIPRLTMPSLCKPFSLMTSADALCNIQPSRFRPPAGICWSNDVACLMDLSLYPYETRWLPLQLLVRDEALDDSVQVKPTDFVRHLNVFQLRVHATRESVDQLKKLNLTAEDVVQCVNFDELKNKLPLGIRNDEIHLPTFNRKPSSGDEWENRNAACVLRATDCGLLWLCFRSDKFWHNFAEQLDTLTEFSNSSNESPLRASRKLFIEVQFEYAVDVVRLASSHCVRHTTTNSKGPISNPARSVSLGFQIQLLSSKHAPLILYHPQLTFRDAPYDSESETDNSVLDDEMNFAVEGSELSVSNEKPSEPSSKSFFHCTLRARLPASLVPRPIRFSRRQYRVFLDLTQSWGSLSQSDSGVQTLSLQTPWTSLSEASPSSVDISTSPVSFGDTAAPSTVEEFKCVEHPDEQLRGDGSTAGVLYQHIVIALDRLSDVVFEKEAAVRLVTREGARMDEIKLPIPADTRALIRCLEANINIVWKSRLHGRPASPSHEASDLDNRALPDPRFYRFGRFMLGAHYAELSVNEKQGLTDALLTRRSTSVIPKPWYGKAFASPAFIAGLVWCHNIRLEIKLSESSYAVGSTLHSICQVCRGVPSRPVKHSICNRRMSSPIDLLSSTYRPGAQVERLQRIAEQSESPQRSGRSRRSSFPDMISPRHFQGLSMNLLSSTSRTCIQPFQPLSIILRGTALQHPMKDMHLSDNPNAIPIKLLRVWIGPVVYEIQQKVQKDPKSPGDPVSILSLPLTEGKDYAFIGNTSGTIGLTLNSQSPQWLNQNSEIVFFRPGRYWICGLIGIIPPDLPLPSVETRDQTTIYLPNYDNVETIRFTPSGITVHVHEQQSTL